MSSEYTTLRTELKQWEREYQAQHGRKPTPNDIRLIPGLTEKYKRFKALSKAAGQTGDVGKPPAPASTGASSGIIRHSRAVEDLGDAIPAAARPNPFSPSKPRPTTSHIASGRRTPERHLFPNPFASPVKKKEGSNATSSAHPGTLDSLSHSPSSSPNPFVVKRLPDENLLKPTQPPDSPFTAARKRIRGDGEEGLGNTMDTDAPDNTKRRRFVNRSQSASYSGLFGTAPYILPDTAAQSNSNTQPSQPGSSRPGEEVLGDSPIKPSVRNGVVYKPIFDDGRESLQTSALGSQRSGTTRTTSLPASLTIFSKRPESDDAARKHLVSSQPVQDDDSLTNDNQAMDEDDPSTSTQLIAPTPVKTGAKQWKGQAKGKKQKTMTHANEDLSDSEQTSDEVQAVEVEWRILGPLQVPGQTDDKGDDDDDENFQLLSLGKPWIRHYSTAEEDGEINESVREHVEIDLPEEMQNLLELSPSKPRVDEDQVVQDILAGIGDRSKRHEVWHVGDVGTEEDDWDSEGAGWWEAEL